MLLPRSGGGWVPIQSAREAALRQTREAASDGALYCPRRMVDRALLTGTALFGSLPAELVDTVAAASASRRLDRNDVLFRAGDAASEMFVLQEGRVAIANRSADGKESVMALMEPGDLF